MSPINALIEKYYKTRSILKCFAFTTNNCTHDKSCTNNRTYDKY